MSWGEGWGREGRARTGEGGGCCGRRITDESMEHATSLKCVCVYVCVSQSVSKTQQQQQQQQHLMC